MKILPCTPVLSVIIIGSLLTQAPVATATSRRLEPNDNIVRALSEELTKTKNPRLTLTAPIERDGIVQHNHLKGSVPEANFLEVHLVLNDQSVDETTTYSIDGGEIKPVNNTLKFLVADHQEADSSEFAFLAVDEETGTVNGIVQQNNILYKWTQEAGEIAVVSETQVIPPDNWTCTVDEESIVLNATDPTRRHLIHNFKDIMSHGHNHEYQIDLSSIDIDTMNQSRRRLYSLKKYSYQVDLFIDVDTAMVEKHDKRRPSTMPNTIAYINAVVSAVSSIYEREIDTHRTCLLVIMCYCLQSRCS